MNIVYNVKVKSDNNKIMTIMTLLHLGASNTDNSVYTPTTSFVTIKQKKMTVFLERNKVLVRNLITQYQAVKNGEKNTI